MVLPGLAFQPLNTILSPTSAFEVLRGKKLTGDKIIEFFNKFSPKQLLLIFTTQGPWWRGNSPGTLKSVLGRLRRKVIPPGVRRLKESGQAWSRSSLGLAEATLPRSGGGREAPWGAFKGSAGGRCSVDKSPSSSLWGPGERSDGCVGCPAPALGLGKKS